MALPAHSFGDTLRGFGSVLFVLVAAGCGVAQAQGQPAKSPLSSITDLITGSVSSPSATPAPTSSASKEWSGESGSSGHPAMTADAIRAAAQNFPQCLENLWPLAAKRGVSRATYERHALTLTPDLRIMDLMDSQPEFDKALWEYMDILVNDTRIQRGREILATHKASFDAVEKHYGVDRYAIAAIWGIESNYGTQGGDRPVVRSTATLACVGRRQDYFRDEFLTTMEILQRGDVKPEYLKGSWAGAFGPTQFMPTSFKRFAVDFDGDGRRDVVESIVDIIASTANNLKKDGWVAGQTWGYEVTLPQGFNYLLADKSKQLTVAQWEQLGVRRTGGKPFQRHADHATLLLPAGAQGPAFLMLPNFRAILKYNPAEAYALAIGHFADRLRGGDPFVQPWPRHERVLSRAERLELQEHLARRGYRIGQPDGRLGAKTRDAIRDFQTAAGDIPDGFASGTVLERLRTR